MHSSTTIVFTQCRVLPLSESQPSIPFFWQLLISTNLHIHSLLLQATMSDDLRNLFQISSSATIAAEGNSPISVNATQQACELLGMLITMAQIMKQLGLSIDSDGQFVHAESNQCFPVELQIQLGNVITHLVRKKIDQEVQQQPQSLAQSDIFSPTTTAATVEPSNPSEVNNTSAASEASTLLATLLLQQSQTQPQQLIQPSQETTNVVSVSSQPQPLHAAHDPSNEATQAASHSRRRPTKNHKREYRHENFPEKLFRIVTDLENEGRADIATFVGNEDPGFYLNNPPAFEKEIMPRYFRGSKLTTFRRQLVFYSFFRSKTGRHQGAFVNPFFIRGRSDLLSQIVRDDRYDEPNRKRGRGNDSTTSSKKKKKDNVAV